MTRRKGHPSDPTDQQWEPVEPLSPPVNTGARPQTHPRRAIVDAILHLVRTGCSRRQPPTDFPPWQTAYRHFTGRENAKATEKIPAAVRTRPRVQQARHPEPGAGPLDSQTVKAAHTLGAQGRGQDAGKKINGRRRFLVTDTLGLLITGVVCAASRRDREGARPVGAAGLAGQPGAVGVRRGRLRRAAARVGHLRLAQHHPHIVGKPAGRRGFAVIPRRPAVERSLAWLSAHRRLVRG